MSKKQAKDPWQRPKISMVYIGTTPAFLMFGMKKRDTLKSVLLLGFAALSMAAYSYFAADAEFMRLKARGARVFAYDNAHDGDLPRHEVVALSFALAFHDTMGAKTALQKLESKLPN